MVLFSSKGFDIGNNILIKEKDNYVVQLKGKEFEKFQLKGQYSGFLIIATLNLENAKGFSEFTVSLNDNGSSLFIFFEQIGFLNNIDPGNATGFDNFGSGSVLGFESPQTSGVQKSHNYKLKLAKYISISNFCKDHGCPLKLSFRSLSTSFSFDRATLTEIQIIGFK